MRGGACAGPDVVNEIISLPFGVAPFYPGDGRFSSGTAGHPFGVPILAVRKSVQHKFDPGGDSESFANQSFSFLFRLRQPRNNCSKFIEYLVPALHLTAIFRALHGFISNEGEFRLAVS